MVGRVTAGIIAVGTELTIGQVLDTNSRYIAQRLSTTGCEVREVLVIPDDRVAMLRAFADFASKYRITLRQTTSPRRYCCNSLVVNWWKIPLRCSLLPSD